MSALFWLRAWWSASRIRLAFWLFRKTGWLPNFLHLKPWECAVFWRMVRELAIKHGYARDVIEMEANSPKLCELRDMDV
jgi:hypothetical protein